MKFENEWIKNNRESKKKEIELIEEMDNEWIREQRMKYLEEELPKAYVRIQEWERCKQKMGEWFMFENEMGKARGKYKHSYTEYGALRGGNNGDEGMFSEEVIQRCREVRVESLIDSKIINAGNGRLKCLCPFHEEKTPSFVIYSDNSWFCFSCRVSGRNAITFVIRKYNFSFPKAVGFLKKL